MSTLPKNLINDMKQITTMYATSDRYTKLAECREKLFEHYDNDELACKLLNDCIVYAEQYVKQLNKAFEEFAVFLDEFNNVENTEAYWSKVIDSMKETSAKWQNTYNFNRFLEQIYIHTASKMEQQANSKEQAEKQSA